MAGDSSVFLWWHEKKMVAINWIEAKQITKQIYCVPLRGNSIIRDMLLGLYWEKVKRKKMLKFFSGARLMQVSGPGHWLRPTADCAPH